MSHHLLLEWGGGSLIIPIKKQRAEMCRTKEDYGDMKEERAVEGRSSGGAPARG